MHEDDRQMPIQGNTESPRVEPLVKNSAMGATLQELVVQVTRPKGLIARNLLGHGVNVLPIEDDGDQADRYVLGRNMAVDRRTPNGFLNGILDKSLFTAAIFLREHFGVAILMIEGARRPGYRGFSPEAIDGALSSLMLEYGLSVLHTDSADETTRLLMMMARQAQHGIAEISLVPKRSAATLPDMQRRVVEMLPGCGRVMARELLRRFHSIAGIVTASASELQEIRGIGAKRAGQIKHVLTADYRSLDTEQQIEEVLELRPDLLLTDPVELIARQHRIRSSGPDLHIVDLVFRSLLAREVILVELKRGTLEPAHRTQLRRYLDIAGESSLLRKYLEAGYRLRGILASPEGTQIRCDDSDICIVQLNAEMILEASWSMRQ